MQAFGKFFWNELNTNDPDGVMAFYKRQFGWVFEEASTAEGGPYWLAKLEREFVAGIIPLDETVFDAGEDFWLPYLSVDGVDSHVESAVAAGAQIIRPLWDIPQTGRRAVLQQPGGALVAWMTPLG